jgi:hypothetical protein
MKVVKFHLNHVLQNQHLFNSGPHPPDSLLNTLPNLGIQEPPDASLTHYQFWYRFVLETQHLDRRRVKILDLHPQYAQLLIGASEFARITGRVPEAYKEELLNARLFNPLFIPPSRPPTGYFLRFNYASAEDGVNGHRALKAPIDAIERIVTSQRAINATNQCLNQVLPVRLFFVPFDPTFDPATEYRCFSDPLSSICKGPKLTAVS